MAMENWKKISSNEWKNKGNGYIIIVRRLTSEMIEDVGEYSKYKNTDIKWITEAWTAPPKDDVFWFKGGRTKPQAMAHAKNYMRSH